MPTTIKAAIKKWEEASGQKAGEAIEIKLIGVYPPIEKLEGPFHLLINCEKLSLSTNTITSIANLNAFKNLKILSLGRNNIKNLQGIEGAAETLEQLWISYNQIEKLKPIRNLSKLQVLYMSHNVVREWREFEYLTELTCLEDLVFIGNPLEEEATSNGKYNAEVIKRLIYLKRLDGCPVIRDAGEEIEEEGEMTALDMNEILSLTTKDDDEPENKDEEADNDKKEDDENGEAYEEEDVSFENDGEEEGDESDDEEIEDDEDI
ncbi:dynein axonemal light chain 1 [Lepeophtheirus salmonis]|nr:dynein light chain 1, axonemal-like [Lepeophtheirus salmonis]